MNYVIYENNQSEIVNFLNLKVGGNAKVIKHDEDKFDLIIIKSNSETYMLVSGDVLTFDGQIMVFSYPEFLHKELQLKKRAIIH